MSPPRWLSEEEDRAWRGFQRLRTVLPAAIARDLLDDAGLSEPDYDVLSNLSETEGHRWRLGDLAARMLWSRSRMSHHVSRMERRGLVIREEDPADGRGAVVALTEHGLRAIEQAAPGHVESVRQHFLDPLTPATLEALAEAAEAIVGRLGDRSPPRQRSAARTASTTAGASASAQNP